MYRICVRCTTDLCVEEEVEGEEEEKEEEEEGS